MSKTTKALAILGVVAGLGVAALPMSAMAAVNLKGDDKTPATDEVVVKTTIKDYISIELKQGTLADDGTFGGGLTGEEGSQTHTDHTLYLGELMNNDMVQGSLLVNVKTNNSKGYKLGIMANGTSTNMVGEDNSHTIATGTGIAKNASTSAWGFKVAKGDASDTKTTIVTGFEDWSAITNSNVKIATYSEGTDTEGVDTEVTFGVAADASQAADTYSATVTFTAATDATVETFPTPAEEEPEEP